MDLGLGVSFDNPVFAGDFCQAFGLGLRAERFADLPVVAEGVEDAAYAPGVFGPYGADDRGSGQAAFVLYDRYAILTRLSHNSSENLPSARPCPRDRSSRPNGVRHFYDVGLAYEGMNMPGR